MLTVPVVLSFLEAVKGPEYAKKSTQPWVSTSAHTLIGSSQVVRKELFLSGLGPLSMLP